MRLVITVDTEEDQWGQYECARYTTSNAHRLPEFQALCDDWSVRPTYLVSYEMASQDESAMVLAPLAERPDVEIGAHCHPWNTPPLDVPGAGSSMLSSLPAAVQYAKLETLTRSIERRFGRRPITFRAGRWGVNLDLARNLARLGYQVDTSVTPFISWAADGGPDYSRAYPEQFWLEVEPSSPQGLLEVPATVGYRQRNVERARRTLNAILRSPTLRRLRAYGILNRLGLLNRIWICPEMTSVKEMIEMTRVLVARGASLVNLMFHSVTLEPGLSPFVQTREDAARFRGRLREYFQFCRSEGFEPALLRDLGNRAGADLPVAGL